MAPVQHHPSLPRMTRSLSRDPGPTPRGPTFFEPSDLYDEDESSFDITQHILQTTNDHIQKRIAKLQADTVRLRRELLLLQRHVKDFRHPFFENWEADMLTRLIEIAHTKQYRKLAPGVVIGEDTIAERETLSRAYSNAAKKVRVETIHKLGLSKEYHQALQRYDEVAAYRSPNPFQTEFAFAKWLIEEKENKPDMYKFWTKLFPVCYGRTVEESASVF